MWSCVRSCASKRLQSWPADRVNNIVPHEPLLFLYPEWFQQYHHRRYRVENRLRSKHVSEDVDVGGQRHLKSSKHDNQDRKLGYLHEVSLDLQHSTSVLSTAIVTNEKHVQQEKTDPEHEEQEGVELDQKPENARLRYRPDNIDGIELAGKLIAISKLSSRVSLERTVVSKEFLQWLVGTADENMWFHGEHTGCKIYVLPPLKESQQEISIALEGSERSRQFTIQYIERMRKEFALLQHGPKVCVDDLTVKGVQRRAAISVQLDGIQQPHIWTVKSFYEYVRKITNSRLSRGAGRITYTKDRVFDQVLSDTILSLFSSSELKPYQSTAALRLALECLRGRTNVTRNIVLIWTSVFDSGLIPDAACFNIELERCLAVNNIERIEYLLWNMRKYHVKPNVKTWSLLFRVLRSQRQRNKVLDALGKNGDLEDSQDRDILVRALIQSDFRAAVKREDGIARFAQSLQRRFGEKWLSPGAVSDMVAECVKSSAGETVHEVLDIARYFGVSLDSVDSTALLDVIRRTGQYADTMHFFISIGSIEDTRAAQRQIEILFKLAWAQRLHNTCRLIWRHAASHGIISYAMQKLVVENLTRNQYITKDGNGEKIKAKVPRLAAMTIGTDVHVSDPENDFPLLWKAGWKQRVQQLLCNWTANDGTRHEQLKLAHLLLERDLTATARWRPHSRAAFRKQLIDAYRLDRRWKSEGFETSASMDDLLFHAIKVGMRRRDEYKATPEVGEPINSRAVKQIVKDEAVIPEAATSPDLSSSERSSLNIPEQADNKHVPALRLFNTRRSSSISASSRGVNWSPSTTTEEGINTDIRQSLASAMFRRNENN